MAKEEEEADAVETALTVLPDLLVFPGFPAFPAFPDHEARLARRDPMGSDRLGRRVSLVCLALWARRDRQGLMASDRRDLLDRKVCLARPARPVQRVRRVRRAQLM